MEIGAGLIVTVVLIILGLALAMYVANRKDWHKWHELHPHHVLESHLVAAKWLLAERLFFGLYAVAIWIYTLATSDNQGAFFSFYTIWNYSMLLLYFLNAAAYMVAFGGPGKSPQDSFSPPRLEVYWRRAIWVMFEITVTMAFLVDIVTWSVLYPDTIDKGTTYKVLNVSSYHVHGLNLLFILVDGVLNNFVLMPSHCLFTALWAMSYALFAWIYYATAGVWNYSFLDTSKDIAPAWYVGLLIGHIGIYLVICFVFRKLKAPRLTKYEGVLPEDDQLLSGGTMY